MKCQRIHAILATVADEAAAAALPPPPPPPSSAGLVASGPEAGAAASPPPLSLEHLRGLPTDDVKASLRRFKGVGPKTVSCVLLFTLGRAEFPVDTHVWRIAKRLGWVPAHAGIRNV